MSGLVLVIIAIVGIAAFGGYGYTQSFWVGSEFRKNFDVALARESIESLRDCNQQLLVEEREASRMGGFSSRFTYDLSTNPAVPDGQNDGFLVIEGNGGTLEMVQMRFEPKGRTGNCALNAGMASVVTAAMPDWFPDDPGCIYSNDNGAWENWATCNFSGTKSESHSVTFRGKTMTMTNDPGKYVDLVIRSN